MLQRSDLARCLDTLLDRAAEGRAYWRVYRQFKMYNDAALNPYLYGGKQARFFATGSPARASARSAVNGGVARAAAGVPRRRHCGIGCTGAPAGGMYSGIHAFSRARTSASSAGRSRSHQATIWPTASKFAARDSAIRSFGCGVGSVASSEVQAAPRTASRPAAAP